MSCAAIHRKMGTHISKVKSLSMDSWSPDQVDNMKRVGNTTSNRTFNPQNVRPDIPTDADEVGGVMERFIRQKYEHKAFVGSRSRSHTVGGASVSSTEGVPPPLPPKPSKKFGFSLGVRSSSATHQKYTPPLSPALTGSDRSSTPPAGRMNKQSRVFGSAVGNQEEETFDTKLASLREMGFPDTRRNSMVLKNVNGNLDKAVETLVRLGDSTSGAQGTLTPMSGSTSGSNANGLYIEKQRAQPEKAAVSTNPFDALDLQPPRRAFTQPAPSTAAPQPSYNPFLQPQPQAPEQQPLQNAFSAMQLSAQQPQQYQNNPFMPQQSQQPIQTPSYPPQHTQQSQQPQAPSNPFLRKTQSQTFAPSNPFGIQLSAAPQNPWLAQPQVQTPQAQSPAAFYQPQQDFFSAQPQQQQPQYQQQPQQQQQNLYQQPPQQLAPQHTSNPYANMSSQPQTNPFQVPQSSQPEPYQSYQSAQQYQHQQMPQQQLQPQPTGRYGKMDIMALYGHPQLAPSRPLQSLPENSMAPPMMPQQQMQQPPQRSVTMPVGSGSMNPFGSGFAAPQQEHQAIAGARHVSQESRDFVGMGNARPHSPDAFAGLSARYAR